MIGSDVMVVEAGHVILTVLSAYVYVPGPPIAYIRYIIVYTTPMLIYTLLHG